MTKKFKINILILSISVLIAALFFPSILFKLYDNKLMGKIYTEKFTEFSPVLSNKLDTKSRIQLICGYGVIDSIVLTDKNEMITSDETENLNIIINEILKMQEIGAFPEINITDKNFNITNKISQTYTDLSSSGNLVKLNYITLSCEDGMITILKDKENNKIYQYEIVMNKSFENIDIPNIAKNLSIYLDMELYNLSFEGENPMRFTNEDKKIKYNIFKSNNIFSVSLSQII